MRSFLAAAAVALALVAGALAAPAAAATLSTGYQPLLMTGTVIGTRYKGPSSGNDLYVGPAAGGFAVRTEAEPTWVVGNNTFSLVYDATTGLLTSTLNSTTVSRNVGAGLFATALQLSLNDRSLTNPLSVSSIIVNGTSMGSLSNSGAFQDYMVSGIPFSSIGFTISGILNRSAIAGNPNESTRFDIRAATAPIPLPAAGWMLLAAFGGLGVMARRRKALA
jgi:hypothetical protein